MINRRLVLTLVGCLAVPLASWSAAGQTPEAARAEIAKAKPKDFPTQPIEITVVYPAGGGMDINGRLAAKFFEKWTGERAIVNNRTGGAGLVGHTYLATQAPKDGYNAGVIASLVFADAMLRANNRWTLADLDPIAFLNSEGVNLVVSAGGAFKDRSLKEIVETAKANPGTVRVGVVPGSLLEYLTDQIEAASGAKFLRVPFQGGAPSLAALLGNNVDLSLVFYSEFVSYIEAKRVTPVAVSSAARSTFLPDVPTVNESLGTNDIVWVISRWVTLPKGVPADRRAYLAEAFNAAASDPEFQAEMRKLGATPDPSINTKEAVAVHLARLAEMERAFFVRTGRVK